MHILVSWDIRAQGARWTEINDRLKECLKGYSWVKPLKTLYIVQIDTIETREAIRQGLAAVCADCPKEVHLILTPAMEGGKYGGWLPKRLWPKIRQRTGDE